jgi:hypothetical protein
MSSEIFWFVGGLAVYNGLLLLRAWKQSRDALTAKRNPKLGSIKEFLPSAACSTDMAPRFEALDMQGAKVRIVGGDGTYFCSDNRKRLSALLKQTVGRGASVEYYLINPVPAALDAIVDLGLDRIERLNFFAFDMGRADEAALALAKTLETKHPTTIEMRNGNALWLEGNHPPKSHHAYGVVYIPPLAMSGSNKELFEISSSEIDGLALACRPLLFERSRGEVLAA